MVSLKYALTKEDYSNYYTYVMWDAPEKKKAHIRYYARQLVINSLIITVLLSLNLFGIGSSYLYYYVGGIVLILVLQFFSARSRIKKQAEKITANEDNESIFTETILHISDTGILLNDMYKEARFNWNAFLKKKENDQYYFLFVNAIQAIIIPKRVFKSAEDQIQFEKLLAQHLSIEAEIGHMVKS